MKENKLAQKTLIQLVDDLDGGVLGDGEGKTVTFALEGVSYEIDLSQAHVDELTEALAPYMAAARKVNSRKSAASTSGAKSDPAELQKIRDWAGKNGHTVSSRGRISAAVRDAYNAAQ
jgi:tetrahydromethanopterin S-methyltransferase subunit B